MLPAIYVVVLLAIFFLTLNCLACVFSLACLCVCVFDYTLGIELSLAVMDL